MEGWDEIRLMDALRAKDRFDLVVLAGEKQ